MNLSNTVLSIIDDPYFSMFSLLVFERLTVEDVRAGSNGWSDDEWYDFTLATQIQEIIHEQRKGE
jgi:hypothetical protein